MGVPKHHAAKDFVLKLMAEKEKIETKISEYGAILTANDNIGMNGPLIDADGFPRSDIDVYQVRQARQQIICLQNDHKTLMKQIEEGLHKLYAEQREEGISNNAADMTINEGNNPGTSAAATARNDPLEVIAIVNMVSAGSPAETAGLRVDDEILEFGSINSRNFQNLNDFAAVVRHMENKQVALKIKRGNQQLELVLIPKIWSGRGLLGCNINLPECIDR